MAAHELTLTEYYVLNWCMFALATIFTSLRLMVRWLSQRRFHDDDWWAFGSWLSLLTLIALYTGNSTSLFFLSNYQKQYNENPQSILTVPFSEVERHYKIFAIVQLAAMFFFWGTLWAGKLSLLSFFRRLMEGVRKYMPYWWSVTIITILTFIGCFLSNWLTCLPLSRRWSADAKTNCATPDAINSIIIAIQYASAVDIATDLLIMMLPLPLLWGLRISMLQKIGLGVIFCLGAIVIVFAIIRLNGVIASIGSVTHTAGIDLAMWSMIECTVAVVVISLPALRGLLTGKLIPTAYGRSTAKPGSAYSTGLSGRLSGRGTMSGTHGTQVSITKGGPHVHIRLHDVEPGRSAGGNDGVTSSSQEELRKTNEHRPESIHEITPSGISMTREVFVSSVPNDEENLPEIGRGKTQGIGFTTGDQVRY